MASVDELLKNQDFLNLPATEIFKGLRAFPDFSGLPAAAQTLVVSNAKKKFPEGPKDKGFFSTLATDVGNLPGTLFEAGNHPINTLEKISHSQHYEFEKGRQERARGNYVQGTAHTVAGAIPILGPAIAQSAEEVGAGQYGQGAAHALEIFGPEFTKAFPNPVISRTVRNVNNAAEETALRSVEKEVRITPGQRAGQGGLTRAERDLQNKPGTAARAEDFFRGQQADVAAAGHRRVSQQPGQQTNALGAGEGVQQTLKARVDNLKSYADKLYDSTRKTTARNSKDVQVGTRTDPASTILDSSGNPAVPARDVAVMQRLESPVSLEPVRQQLKPVYDELAKNLPEAKRANSPAYRALDELMQSGTQQLNAMDFDRFLGAVKAITRDGNSSVLSTQSQRLARQVIGAGEKSFKDAISGAGPNVVDKLTRARKAVREYHETAEFLDDLHSEPAALYANLTTGGDRVQNTLKYLNRTAPKAIDTVGRTYLEGLMDKATREGGWGRSEGVFADWNKMGPETKNLVFGPQLTKNLDDFLLAAKRLTPAAGSATADRLSAISHYGDIGLALSEFIGGTVSGHPAIGAGGAAATLGATRVYPEILARLSFKPAGATALKQAVTLPINSTGFQRAMQTINSLAIDQEDKR